MIRSRSGVSFVGNADIVDQELVIASGSWAERRRPWKIRRGNIRLVGIEVVQKGKEWSIGPPPAQPAQEIVGDLARTARLKRRPLLLVE